MTFPRILATLPLTLALAALPAMTLANSHGQGGGHGDGRPGAHFVENWDLDGDGQVTLEEIQTFRGDIFYSFDLDGNGLLEGTEYDSFDTARANDMATQGNHGAAALQPVNEGMTREANDLNNDGAVSEEEFLTAAAAWLARMDTNGDGVVTTDDFGQGRGQGNG